MIEEVEISDFHREDEVVITGKRKNLMETGML
jgi:hypothetical protein